MWSAYINVEIENKVNSIQLN